MTKLKLYLRESHTGGFTNIIDLKHSGCISYQLT